MNDATTMRMFLTTAVLAAVAALIAGPAHAVNLDVEGGGSGAAVPAPIGPGTIPYLSHGLGVDESRFSGEATLGLTGDSALTRQGQLSSQQSPQLTGVHAALQRDRAVQAGAASAVQSGTASPGEPGTIPYLSHGIGVDESLFSGEPSSGPTATWAGRVADTMPEGLTGDSALTRTDLSSPSSTAQASSSGSDTDWTWIGLGAGMAALLAAAGAGLYFSARHRGRIALP